MADKENIENAWHTQRTYIGIKHVFYLKTRKYSEKQIAAPVLLKISIPRIIKFIYVSETLHTIYFDLAFIQ